jgi:putative ABC transport system permease protein
MIFKIAFRNIFRQKRRTILTVLTMMGGFTLACFSIGWMEGTYNNIINTFTRTQLGHIQIHYDDYLDRPKIYKTIQNADSIGAIIMGIKGITAWTPRILSSGLASLGDKTTGIQIIGIDPVREENATNFDKKLIKGKPLSKTASHETILGKSLAAILQADLDSEVVVISQGADGSMANDIYKVVGIIESGDDISDRTVFYLHIDDARDLLVLYGQVHEIVIVCDNLDEVREKAVEIASVLNNPKLSVEPWQQFAKAFYEAMQSDKEGSWVMLFVVVLIVAVGVLNTVLMTVLERRREYGVLRAVGMRPGEIFRMVIYEVAVMAVISVFIGSVLGFAVNYFFSIHGIPMPYEFTYGGMLFSRGYTELNFMEFYIPALAVIGAALLIAIMPSLNAARIEPAKAMRMH